VAQDDPNEPLTLRAPQDDPNEPLTLRVARDDPNEPLTLRVARDDPDEPLTLRAPQDDRLLDRYAKIFCSSFLKTAREVVGQRVRRVERAGV